MKRPDDRMSVNVDVFEKYKKSHNDLQRARIIMKHALKFVKQLHNNWECQYDNPDSEYYDDGGIWEMISEITSVIEKMSAIINDFEDT